MSVYRTNVMEKIAVAAVSLFAITSPMVAYAADTDNAANGTTSRDRTIDETIDKAAEQLKEALKKLGNKADEAQKYLQNYDWKDLVPKPHSGLVSISDATFNGKRVACVVKPGERIEGELSVVLDKDKMKDTKYNRIIIGFKDVGAQTSVGLGSGIGHLVPEAEHTEKFTLIAPVEPGLYQVRFRPVDKITDTEAFILWKDEQGNQPSAASTIGFIWVKE